MGGQFLSSFVENVAMDKLCACTFTRTVGTVGKEDDCPPKPILADRSNLTQSWAADYTLRPEGAENIPLGSQVSDICF